MGYRGKRSISAAAGLAVLLAAVPAWTAGAAGRSPILRAMPGPAGQTDQAEIVWAKVPGPGKKTPINDDYDFRYEFSEKPKMGTIILKIQVFNKKGKQVVPYLIAGRADMPSMQGAHDSGEVEFKLNKRNDYLLPVNVVMPGDWEIRVVMKLNGLEVYHGVIRFDV